ncbi:MAG TPA: alpha/beta hydrolase [Longimicrobium sp.]|jgi:pimeloyl-ACP methyl ester carboxylesterase
MPTRSSHRRTALAAGAAALLAAACTDRNPVVDTPLAPTGPHTMMAYQEPAMDPADTYVSMSSEVESSTTITLAEPVYDASTGQSTTTLTLTGPAESRSIEAGYDTYDQVLVNTYRQPDGLDPEAAVANQVRAIKTVAADYNQYDANGSYIPADKPDGSVTTSPLAVLGSLQGVSITQGVIIEDASSDPGTPRPQGLGGLGGDVDYPDPSTLRITSTLFGGGVVIQGAGAAQPDRGTLTRVYKRRGQHWVLQEVVTEATASTGEATFATRQTMRISNVKFRINKQKEARRLQATRERPDPQFGREAAPSTVPDRLQMCAYSYNTYALCRDPGDTEPIDPGTGGGTTTPPPGANIVFQHGFLSNAGAWSRMDPWISERFYLNTKLVPSLNGNDRAFNQATDLIGRIDATGQKNFILVGSSMGGLVARSVAQRRGDLARGVITLSTPHQGALLARNGRQALSGYLNGQLNRLYFGCQSPYQDVGCYIAYIIGNYAVDQALQWAIDAALPGQIDLQPNNSFVQQLNSTPEAFTRVGIESYANKRFVLARLAGDRICNPESACGGRAFASYAQWGYSGFVSCSVIASLLGYWNTAYWCAYIYRRMDDVDRGWDQITAPGMTSDGIVQGPSQVYPNANQQYPINGGDSHLGGTRSDKMRDRLVSALSNNFAVPRKF